MEIEPQSVSSPKKPLMIGGLWVFSLLWVFGAGFILHSLLSSTTFVKPSSNPPKISPLPTLSVSPGPKTTPSSQPDFVPFTLPSQGAGLSYFDDTVTAITQTDPPQFVAMTYSVTENAQHQFIHSTRVSFFDGQQWHRNKHVDTSDTTTFIPNPVITDLHIFQDRNRVLRQRVDSKLVIDGVSIQINSNVLENEVAMRTEPTYTRMISDSTGEVTIQGNTYPSRLMYTKWYSMDQEKLSFYNSSYNLKTHVIDFWGDDGSVLHLDSTDVSNPDELYSSHMIGIFKDKESRVSKTFQLNIQTSGEKPPVSWNVHFDKPLDIQFQGTTLSFLDKADGANYDWFRGLLNGQLTLSSGEVVKGIGTFEYIDER